MERITITLQKSDLLLLDQSGYESRSAAIRHLIRERNIRAGIPVEIELQQEDLAKLDELDQYGAGYGPTIRRLIHSYGEKSSKPKINNPHVLDDDIFT